MCGLKNELLNYVPTFVQFHSNQYFDNGNISLLKFNIAKNFLCKTSKLLVKIS